MDNDSSKNMEDKDQSFIYLAKGKEILIYHGNGVTIKFCDFKCYPEFIQLRLWGHTYEEEETKIFIDTVKINGISIRHQKYVGAISSCQNEYMYINVCGTNESSVKDFDTLEIQLITETEKYDTVLTKKLYFENISADEIKVIVE